MHTARFDDDDSPWSPRLRLPLLSWSKSGSYHISNLKIVLCGRVRGKEGSSPILVFYTWKRSVRNDAHCRNTCDYQSSEHRVPLLKYTYPNTSQTNLTAGQSTRGVDCRWHRYPHSYRYLSCKSELKTPWRSSPTAAIYGSPTGSKGFHVPQHKTHAIFTVPLGSAYLGLIFLYRFYLFFNHGSQWHAWPSATACGAKGRDQFRPWVLLVLFLVSIARPLLDEIRALGIG